LPQPLKLTVKGKAVKTFSAQSSATARDDLSCRVPNRSLAMLTGFFMLSPWKIVKVLNKWSLKGQILTIQRKWNCDVFPLQLIHFKLPASQHPLEFCELKQR